MKKIILAAALVVAGCVHTTEKEESTDQTPKQGRPPADAAPKSPQRQKAQKDEADTRPPAEAGRPELSTSADALMNPEGPRLIQDALAQRGYLAADHKTGKLDPETSAALRKFQGEEEVARTGFPDRETVRKLGLSIEKVFKATGTNAEHPGRGR
ncbi:MAG: peptidoglycan-binding protein [Archangium sp.]|nr:peptidoglycan-binding protein [Archangium sp.]MDP3154497.1 peptidoglycan-binding protein [Archangium sp.]MDP3572898.1 peptidoglycan-binding protein [Archangium sp.]